MDIFNNLAIGFQAAFTATSLFYCFVGVVLGTVIGVLPGLGPIATIAMLLPVTFTLPPIAALIMIAGIYYGAQYGGSATAILINVPGESSSVVTAIDGYQMARKGRAGSALAAAALGSFFAGTVATLFIAFFAPPLSEAALRFGPAEYFALMLLGLVGCVLLARGSVLKASAMIVLGVLFGMVGTDLNSGAVRYSFGIPELSDGLNFVIVAMGMFSVGEIILNLENNQGRDVFIKRVKGLLLSRDDFRRIVGPVIRGTIVGSILGVLPGGGAILSSFAAYTFEKKVSPNSAEFGHGAIEGVAAPESANNAGAQTSFIPMLTLGIPSNPVMALIIGAMLIHGIQPGPEVMIKQPELFWGLIVSMWVGNVMLVVLNLPMVGLWVRLLSVPYHVLVPIILVFCAIGVFSLGNTVIDVYLMAAFGLIGYVFAKLGCEVAPLLLGFILGPLIEEYLRRALVVSRGDPMIFLERPISAVMLALAAIAFIVILAPSVRASRDVAFKE